MGPEAESYPAHSDTSRHSSRFELNKHQVTMWQQISKNQQKAKASEMNNLIEGDVRTQGSLS